jgi:hypothetical protein
VWLAVAAVGTGTVGATLAADAIDPATSFTQYGIAGVIAAAASVAGRWLVKRLLADRDADRERLIAEIADERARGDARCAEANARADRLEGDLRNLNTLIQTQVMNALNEATRAVSDTISLIRSGRR